MIHDPTANTSAVITRFSGYGHGKFFTKNIMALVAGETPSRCYILILIVAIKFSGNVQDLSAEKLGDVYVKDHRKFVEMAEVEMFPIASQFHPAVMVRIHEPHLAGHVELAHAFLFPETFYVPGNGVQKRFNFFVRYLFCAVDIPVFSHANQYRHEVKILRRPIGLVC